MARNRRLVERLVALGIPITYDEAVAEAASEESLGRPHFAALLVEKGAAESIPDAFDRWLANGRPAYVPKARIHPADIAAPRPGLRGGVRARAPVDARAARPTSSTGPSASWSRRGSPASRPTTPATAPTSAGRCSTLADRHDLVATGGSDYHGTVKPGLSVGTGRGDLSVPDEALEALAARRP